MIYLLLTLMLSGCSHIDQPVVPEPVKEIKRMYEKDWASEGHTQKATVEKCDVRVWYNLATLAELLIKDPQSIPARSGSRYRSRSNKHLIYDIQLLTTLSAQNDLRHILSVETFRCTQKIHLHACLSEAAHYDPHSSDGMIVTSQAFEDQSSDSVPGWLVGLRVIVAAVYPNSTVHVSDQYSTFLQ
jgi:hypothetical protein